MPIEHKKRLSSCVADSLVAVYERMILDERESQSGSFRTERRIQILSAKGLAGLTQGGLQSSEVAKPVRATGLRDEESMKLEYLRECEVSDQRSRSYNS